MIAVMFFPRIVHPEPRPARDRRHGFPTHARLPRVFALFFSRRSAPVRAAPAEGGVVQGGVMDSGAAAVASVTPGTCAGRCGRPGLISGAGKSGGGSGGVSTTGASGPELGGPASGFGFDKMSGSVSQFAVSSSGLGSSEQSSPGLAPRMLSESVDCFEDESRPSLAPHVITAFADSLDAVCRRGCFHHNTVQSSAVSTRAIFSRCMANSAAVLVFKLDTRGNSAGSHLNVLLEPPDYLVYSCSVKAVSLSTSIALCYLHLERWRDGVFYFSPGGFLEAEIFFFQNRFFGV